VNGRQVCEYVREISRGTGVVISNENGRCRVLTASHIFDDTDANWRPTVHDRPAKILKRDTAADVDLALLEVDLPPETDVATLSDTLSVGDQASIAGLGRDERTDGRLYREISGRVSSPGWITGTVRDGDSGGPVFRGKRLHGIIHGTNSGGRTAFTPAPVCFRFLLPQIPVPQQRVAPLPRDIPDTQKTDLIRKLLARIDVLEDRLEAQEATISALKFAKGPKGDPGKDGKDGKDALTARIRIVYVDAEGNEVDLGTREKKDGETITIGLDQEVLEPITRKVKE
jgi:hypothetical protein